MLCLFSRAALMASLVVVLSGLAFGDPSSPPLPANTILKTPPVAPHGGTTSLSKAESPAPTDSFGTRLKNKAQAFVEGLRPAARKQLEGYKLAEALFPPFCRDWGRKLAERQEYNREKADWHLNDGNEVATYVGYGPIESCQAKQSSRGIPIGKLTYKEFVYRLAGKTLDQAKRAIPRAVRATRTLEIFAWDADKWNY